MTSWLCPLVSPCVPLAWWHLSLLRGQLTRPSLSGHQQTEAGAAATGEEEATGGEAPSQGPGEQERPQGQ